MKTGSFAKPKRSNRNKRIKSIDPFFTGERPVDRKEARCNENPKKDEGELTSKMKEFMERKTKAVQNKNKNTQKLKPEGSEGIQFRQRKREKEKDFMRRIDYETQLFIQKTKMEDKFKIHSQKDEELFGGGKANKTSKTKRHLLMKKKKQSEDKLLRRDEKHDDFAHLKDEIKFGEVALEPPKFKNAALKESSQKTKLLLDEQFPDLIKPKGLLQSMEEERESHFHVQADESH